MLHDTGNAAGIGPMFQLSSVPEWSLLIFLSGTEELSAATSSEPDFSDTCRRGKKKKITLGLQDQDVAVLPLAGLSWLLAMDT